MAKANLLEVTRGLNGYGWYVQLLKGKMPFATQAEATTFRDELLRLELVSGLLQAMQHLGILRNNRQRVKLMSIAHAAKSANIYLQHFEVGRIYELYYQHLTLHGGVKRRAFNALVRSMLVDRFEDLYSQDAYVARRKTPGSTVASGQYWEYWLYLREPGNALTIR